MIDVSQNGVKKPENLCDLISDMIEYFPKLHETNFQQPGQEEIA